MFKKLFVSLSASALLLVPTFLPEIANAETSNLIQHDSDAMLKERLDKIHEASDIAYEKVLKEHNKEKEAVIKSFGKESINQLTLTEKSKIKELETKNMEKALKAIEKNMLKNGYVKVENNENTESDYTTQANSSDLSLTDSLYYDSNYGVYTFIGSWNFRDGSWSKYNDYYDLAAFRANNKPSSILRSSGVAYDNFGNYNGSLVTKRFEDAHGVVYNVEDTYVNPPSAPEHMLTDNGRITVDFRHSGYNKVFLDYEHNYQKYSWIGSASFSGVNLTGSQLSVSYTKSNYNWLRTSTGEIKY